MLTHYIIYKISFWYLAVLIPNFRLEFMFIKHYAPNRYEPSTEVYVKMGVRPGGLVDSKVGGSGWCGVNAKKGVRMGVKGGCGPRIDPFGGLVGGGRWLGYDERRIEVIVKMQNKPEDQWSYKRSPDIIA